MTEDTYGAAIRDALRDLKVEFEGELSLSEKLGVCAAQVVVNGDLLKRILATLQAIEAATNEGRD